jgi:hypothetical protein
MKGLSNPRQGLSLALSRKFFIRFALLLTATLFITGCQKGNFLGVNESANSSGNTGSTNQSNNNDNPEVIKTKANDQGQATQPDKGNFTVYYSDVKDTRFAEMNEKFKQQKFLESIADELNATIAIPENVAITFRECGTPNAFWDPKSRSINMCYELMEQMAEDFKPIAKSQQDLNDKVSGAMTFAFIHELGHCLIDVLHLPSTGREEDAVDQLSTFVLLALNGEDGERMALSGALAWGIQYQRIADSGKTAKELDMLWADEHSMDGQRFYNILCWIFGHNPEKYQGLVNKPLPEARARRCPVEYTKLATAWLTLLKPYLKDGGAKASAHTKPMTGEMDDGNESTPSPTPEGGHSGH